jgi:hypothetical protein
LQLLISAPSVTVEFIAIALKTFCSLRIL